MTPNVYFITIEYATIVHISIDSSIVSTITMNEDFPMLYFIKCLLGNIISSCGSALIAYPLSNLISRERTRNKYTELTSLVIDITLNVLDCNLMKCRCHLFSTDIGNDTVRKIEQLLIDRFAIVINLSINNSMTIDYLQCRQNFKKQQNRTRYYSPGVFSL